MEGTETGRKGAAKHGSFEGTGAGWKDEEVGGERSWFGLTGPGTNWAIGEGRS